MRSNRYNRAVPVTEATRGPVTRPRSLDPVDRGIIEALQDNGRAPFRAIAARVGVAEATVRSRYARLVEVVCADRRHLLELTTRAREVDGVVSTETFPYLSLAKQVYAWGTHLVEEENP